MFVEMAHGRRRFHAAIKLCGRLDGFVAVNEADDAIGARVRQEIEHGPDVPKQMRVDQQATLLLQVFRDLSAKPRLGLSLSQIS